MAVPVNSPPRTSGFPFGEVELSGDATSHQAKFAYLLTWGPPIGSSGFFRLRGARFIGLTSSPADKAFGK